jgi:indole-3-glycerol phosphate synthase
MASILDKIVAYKRDEVAAAKAQTSERCAHEKALQAAAPRGFLKALKAKAKARQPGLIAEIKKASPSAGLIRPDFDPASLAQAYVRGGADCLSVLTDGPSFQGSEDALKAARGACDLPVLRKDFMIDTWQIAESRAMGADCILVIMACVDDGLARDLIEAARAYGMDSLVEVHDGPELDRAVAIGAEMIGINNRNLKTFETRLDTTQRLAARLPDNVLVVAESGIRHAQDLRILMSYGAHAFLVGESLMRAQDVAAATADLLAPAA